MGKRFDPSAVASDIPRSRKQYLARALSSLVVRALGLNRAGFLRTEFVQMIQPVARIETRHGPLICRCVHGRLLWLARRFHIEEPETVAWLDGLGDRDVLWDVGANVGLFSIYAAKFRRCRVLAFEPEAQNYALLVDNIALNAVGDKCFPMAMAIGGKFGLGRLQVGYLTKGGAYHHFDTGSGPCEDRQLTLPPSPTAAGVVKGRVEQYMFGVSLDELLKYDLPPPSYLKIDVDGLEPEIIDGASKLLGSDRLLGVLIEINRKSPRDLRIPEILKQHGFHLVSERSNWLSRTDRTREQDIPTTNLIFSKAP